MMMISDDDEQIIWRLDGNACVCVPESLTQGKMLSKSDGPTPNGLQ